MKTVIRPETEMKDSGIEWVENIPKNWRLRKINSLFETIGSGTTPNSNIEEYYQGMVNWLQSGDINGTIVKSTKKHISNEIISSTSALTVYKAPFIVIAMYGASIGNISMVDIDACTNQACCALVKPIKDIDMQYAFWGLMAAKEELVLSSRGGGQPNISQNIIKQLRVPVPYLQEQQAIANYLDETCSKIDEIIAEAKASIDEYKELKQAVIFDGISLGTRKCCDYKRTTLKGIEKIPIEWEYRKLKFLIRYIESGVSVNAGNEPATELEYGVLKTSCVSKMIFLPSENKSVNKDEYDRVKCPVCGDTIIVSRMNTPDLVGACAYIEKNIDNIFLPDRLWQVHFNDNVNVKYIYYCLISPYIRNYYSSLSTGTSSSMQNISQGQFTNAIIPYPPLEEQKEIVDFLDKRTKEIDSLIAEKESLINDLEAYKKSLIYEVVTGKRRVV